MSQNPAEPPAPPAVDISSAEAMRDKVGRVARAIAKARECEPTEEQAASCIWAHDNFDGEQACLCVLSAIAAIEALPEPPPDPRDAMIGTDVSDAAIAEEEARERDSTIARLSAELEAASNAILDALNQLDPIVHALGIEDSFKTPVEAIAEKDATIARLSAELEAAREALAPFATLADQLDDPELPAEAFAITARRIKFLASIRSARAALAKLSKGA